VVVLQPGEAYPAGLMLQVRDVKDSVYGTGDTAKGEIYATHMYQNSALSFLASTQNYV